MGCNDLSFGSSLGYIDQACSPACYLPPKHKRVAHQKSVTMKAPATRTRVTQSFESAILSGAPCDEATTLALLATSSCMQIVLDVCMGRISTEQQHLCAHLQCLRKPVPQQSTSTISEQQRLPAFSVIPARWVLAPRDCMCRQAEQVFGRWLSKCLGGGACDSQHCYEGSSDVVHTLTNDALSPMSASTTSTFSSLASDCAFAALRVTARTVHLPCLSKASTTAPPCAPVAPSTAIMGWPIAICNCSWSWQQQLSLCSLECGSGWNGATLYQRSGCPHFYSMDFKYVATLAALT